MAGIYCPCGSGRRSEDCCFNPIGGPPKPLKRYQIWSQRYMKRRYLEHLSVEELVARANDILTNMATLTSDLKIGLHPIHETGETWMILWGDILTECGLRDYKYPYPLDHNIGDAKIPDFDWPGLPQAIQEFKRLNLKEGTYWVKYGLSKYLSETLKNGALRISPASSYNDPSLNYAQQDDELEISFFGLPSEVSLEAIDGKTGKSKGKINPVGNVKYTVRAPTNYYTCCLSLTFNQRLFGDFSADCALIIKEPKEFLNRLLKGFREKLSGYSDGGQPVKYFDPLGKKPMSSSVFFAKHFRFWYQQEYRVIWMPPSPVDKLDPVFVEMETLEDICEIICLPPKV